MLRSRLFLRKDKLGSRYCGRLYREKRKEDGRNKIQVRKRTWRRRLKGHVSRKTINTNVRRHGDDTGLLLHTGKTEGLTVEFYS